MSNTTITLTRTVRICDRCHDNDAYIIDMPDTMSLVGGTIDLCRDCADEVVPDLFNRPTRQRRRNQLIFDQEDV